MILKKTNADVAFKIKRNGLIDIRIENIFKKSFTKEIKEAIMAKQSKKEER